MPSKSRAQQRLMFAAAKDAKLRKKKGISSDVVKEFVAADKARGPKKLPERVAKTPPKPPMERKGKPSAKPKKDSAAAREFRLRNAKI